MDALSSNQDASTLKNHLVAYTLGACGPPLTSRYAGSVKLKQRDFGITPVTAGGGTVKVKDELRLDFAIALR